MRWNLRVWMVVWIWFSGDVSCTVLTFTFFSVGVFLVSCDGVGGVHEWRTAVLNAHISIIFLLDTYPRHSVVFMWQSKLEICCCVWHMRLRHQTLECLVELVWQSVLRQERDYFHWSNVLQWTWLFLFGCWSLQFWKVTLFAHWLFSHSDETWLCVCGVIVDFWDVFLEGPFLHVVRDCCYIRI
jgi:hypothetical protein